MRRVSKRESNVDLNGYVFPWRLDEDQPVLVQLEDTYFVVVFSTPAKLAEARPQIGPHRIKQIEDSYEFLDSVLPHFRVMLDPWIVSETNTTRFTEVIFRPRDNEQVPAQQA